MHVLATPMAETKHEDHTYLVGQKERAKQGHKDIG